MERGPRLARWLVALAVPASERDWILGDLDEKYGRLLRARGRRRAVLWYLSQALRSLSPSTLFGWPRGRATVAASMAPGFAQAIRRVRHRPVQVASIVVLLSVGLGGVVAIVSIFAALLYPRVGIDHAGEVGWLIATDSAGVDGVSFSGDELDAIGAALDAPVVAFVAAPASVRAGSEVRSRLASWVSADYFAVLGGRASAGRLIGGDSEPGVVVSHSFRATSFASDASALGSTIVIDRVAYPIVGIAEEGFDGAEHADAWLPLAARADDSWRRRPVLRVLARLGDDAAVIRAATSAESVLGRRRDARLHVRFRRVTDPVSGAESAAIRFSAMLLGSLALLVFAGACAGVSNLVAADAFARQPEMAMRIALGADRRGLAAMILIENVVIGLLSVPFALAAVSVLMWCIPAWLPVGSASVQGYSVGTAGVFLCAGLASLCMIVASLPAVRVATVSSVVRARTGAAVRSPRIFDAVLAIQFTQSIVLIVVAGLLVQSMRSVRRLSPGFEPRSTRVARIALPSAAYDSMGARFFYEGLLDRLGRESAIAAAGLSGTTPVISRSFDGIRASGAPEPSAIEASVVASSSGFFEAMGIPLERGGVWRDGAQDVAIVTADLARSIWPDGDAIGREIVTTDGARYRITGIAGTGTQGGIEPVPTMYRAWDFSRRTAMTIVMRGAGGPQLDVILRRIVAGLDPELPVSGLGSLDDLLDRGQLLQKAMTQLALLFGLLAVAISAFGIHAQVDRHARGRTRDVGIRLALGASPGRASSVIWSRAMRVAVAGLVIGIGLSLPANIIASRWFFGLSPLEPAILGAAAALLAAIAAIAVIRPTYRAVRTAPIRSLSGD